MDEAKSELVRDWLTRASHDLAAAEKLSNSDDQLLDTAIYHCHQAAEKALKGWLQWQDSPFPKTHDIEELISRASKLNPDFQPLAEAAETLTPYASAFRYPGGWDEPMSSRSEFDVALRHAGAIFEFVLSVLPPEARPN